MKRLKFILMVLILVLPLVLSGCNHDYKISFDANLGNQIDPILISKLKELEELPTPKREGYRFLGWYDQENQDKLIKLADIKDLKTSFFVIAKWEILEYEVKFQNEEVAQIVIKVEHGKTVSKPNDPIKEGHNFLYWSLTKDGLAFDFKTLITSNLVLYPVFEEIIKPSNYIISFESNEIGRASCRERV